MTPVLTLPRTPAGRALMAETARMIRSASTRWEVLLMFDWDGSAEELARVLEEPEARHG
ncbi:hypothetical protein [Rhodocista pekingensis]|uniref:Uncharacterized protein n=1 Tax=Rhodocista pekingensis TaxID=201185 RepID=A0ABW2KSJ3_9PROT